MDNRNNNNWNSEPMKAAPKSSEKTSFTHKVGDAIERVGEKLQDMGAEKAGKAVYRKGNEIEHSRDNKQQK